MHHLHILCEGQTEEMIASDVLASHFSGANAYVTWSVLTTKRPAGGPAFKGGVSTWPKLERELRLLLHDSSMTVLTTLLDYYAFPAEAHEYCGDFIGSLARSSRVHSAARKPGAVPRWARESAG